MRLWIKSPVLGEYYYAVMKFNEKNQLYVQWINRAHNKTICMLYAMHDSTGIIVLIIQEGILL